MWTKQQEMAINKKKSNILVSASAGSGKTAILVERVISTCINEKVDIDKLLVVTFTNASAAELKERLICAIYNKLKSNPSDRFLKRQLKLIGRANITTIHSFCLNLIRSNFYTLNIDPTFRICEGAEILVLKNKAISRVIEEKYAQYNKMNAQKVSFSDILELFLQDETKMVAEILKLYDFSLSFPYPLEYIKESIERYNIELEGKDLSEYEFGKNIMDEVLSDMKVLAKRCEKLYEETKELDGFEKYLDVIDDDIKQINKIISKNEITWDELYRELNNLEFDKNPRYSGENQETKNKLMYFRNNVLKDERKKMLKSVYAASSDILKQNQIAYQYLNFIYEIIEEFDAEYKKLKSKKNVLDFSDIEHLALNLLVEKEAGKFSITEVAKSLKEELYEIYTDEYQDTSYVQEAILSAISKENNRFMVGDIKQSIYKFRQAMPDIFNEKYLNYKKIDDVNEDVKECKIILDKNFRSKKIVLDSINFIFKKIMSMEIGDCMYSDEETLKNGNTEFENFENQSYLTEINIIDVNKNAESSKLDEFIDEKKNFEYEAIMIAKKVKQLVGNFMIYDLKEKKFRASTYKDIVILLRSMKDKASIIEKVFKEEKIPVFCDFSSSLLESDEVKLVLAFLKVLDNPLQDIYLASIMYSIIGGFTLDELAFIRNNDKSKNLYFNLLDFKDNKENIAEKYNPILVKIESFLSLLDKFNSYKYVFNISQLLTRIYKETNLYYEFALEENANVRKANLDLLIDIAIEFEKNESSSLASYIDYIDSIKEKNEAMQAAKTIGENEDVVRVMTIHKSKGLEFGIVILADTNKKYNFKDKSSTIIMHQKLGIGINVIDKENRVTYPSVFKKAVANMIDTETRSEEMRMLYVALTRAKEKLIIFATVNDYDKTKEKELVLYENEKIAPCIISKNNSYFQNIHMCMKSYDLDLFEVNVYKLGDVKEENNEGKLNKKSISIDDISKDAVDKIKSNLDYEYEFKKYVTAPKRVSVTSIKNDNMVKVKKEADSYLDDEYIKSKYSIDRVFSNKKMTSMQKGTLTHFIMQYMDFSIDTVEKLNEHLNLLVSRKIITKDELKYVNVDGIYKFLKSNLADRLRKSSYIRQEEQFILNDESISLSQIQGIIDLYFLNENGNFEVVDFKTDRIESEEEFIKKYKMQLDIYASAISQITGKKVEKKIIYSLKLNKEIEV